jgi:uncharacterized membrane protein YecN with MAPEG domain
MLRQEVVALYAGINILLLLVLGYLVTRARRTHKIALGDGGNDPMLRAIRAHANAAEYIPAALVGLLMLSYFNKLPDWLIHASGISLTAGRILHAVGLHMGKLNLGRVAGTVLTYIAYLLIGGALVYVGLFRQAGG